MIVRGYVVVIIHTLWDQPGVLIHIALTRHALKHLLPAHLALKFCGYVELKTLASCSLFPATVQGVGMDMSILTCEE